MSMYDIALHFFFNLCDGQSSFTVTEYLRDCLWRQEADCLSSPGANPLALWHWTNNGEKKNRGSAKWPRSKRRERIPWLWKPSRPHPQTITFSNQAPSTEPHGLRPISSQECHRDTELRPAGQIVRASPHLSLSWSPLQVIALLHAEFSRRKCCFLWFLPSPSYLCATAQNPANQVRLHSHTAQSSSVSVICTIDRLLLSSLWPSLSTP